MDDDVGSIYTLDQWRRIRGMSFRRLAVASGLSLQTIQRALAGETLRDATRATIATALDVSVLQVAEFRRAILGDE